MLLPVRLSIFRVSLLSLFVFAMAAATLYYQQGASIQMDSIARESTDIDELDYHFIAVNFALRDQFPVIGFVAEPQEYKLRYQEGSVTDSFFIDMFRVAGPVVTLHRPPLYPLLVGILYKILGFRLSTLIWFNLLLLAAMAGFLPFIGYSIWRTSGLISGLAGAGLLLTVSPFPLTVMYPDILSAFLFLLMFYSALLIEMGPRGLRHYFLFGAFTGLGLLCKPTFIFLLPLYFLYSLFISARPRFATYVRPMAAFVLGVAIFAVPWSFYIGHQKNISAGQRRQWADKVATTLDTSAIYHSKEEVMASTPNMVAAVKNFVRLLYIYHSDAGDQSLLMGDGLLYLNNEYCIDNPADFGTFGWLWKVIPDSYYHTHYQSSNSFSKIFHFYIDHPSYLYKIPRERLRLSAEYPMVFWLAPALWALAAIGLHLRYSTSGRRLRIYHALLLLVASGYIIVAVWHGAIADPSIRVALFIPVYAGGLLAWPRRDSNLLSSTLPMFWFSIFCFIFFVYGDQRFTLIALAVSCLSVPLYIFTIVQQLITPVISINDRTGPSI